MRQMKKGTGSLILILLVLILGGMGFLSASIIREEGVAGVGEGSSLKLGLDLAGGVSITYGVVGATPSAEAMADTIVKLQQRIENDLSEQSATTEANVYPVGDRRISVEIPGVTDANAILEELGTPGQLYFIVQTDEEGNQNYSAGSGYYELTKSLDELVENGSVVATGTDVVSSRAGYSTNNTTGAQSPIVELQFSSSAAESWTSALARAYEKNESIGIYYDGAFISVPSVNSANIGTNCVIEGMESYEAAERLAAYIRIGGLNVQLEELQSEVVGAQLGSNAITTSITAGAIGICLVILFLLVVYLVPGLAASLALLLYTTIIICLLQAFEITLTLPGIAGIILTIGMAVDANVIIFARIREELEGGKSVRASVDIGFKKALGAILDGNITTLIAAIVLAVLGSGTVRGFATTLAMGVIVSMFTALFITRLILNCFIAVGLDKPAMYGRAIKLPSFDFIGKKAIFMIISAVIIVVGIATMGINSVSGKGALDYSLEFLGGTSTTVGFSQDYSLEELDSKVVPVISSITGDNDIQTQKVQGSNDVIIKTRNLALEEREALNNALKENFGVEEASVSSESIGSVISGEMRSQSIIAVLVAVLCMLVYIWIRFRDIRFASSAIICLIHDVLIVLTLYAVARLTVGSAFIACMLTVIGYSINATIVVYDRVRENLGKGLRDKETLTKIANESVNQTVSRSVATSITTAITVLMLLILGVSTIREFALPLLAGVVAGTWSSVFLATALWYIMRIKIGKGYIEKTDRPNKTQKANKDNQGIIV